MGSEINLNRIHLGGKDRKWLEPETGRQEWLLLWALDFLSSPRVSLLCGALWSWDVSHRTQLGQSTCWSFPGTKFKETTEEHMVSHPNSSRARPPARSQQQQASQSPGPECKEGPPLERCPGHFGHTQPSLSSSFHCTAVKSGLWEHFPTPNF